MRVVVKKVKWNKGQTENGNVYDYTRVEVEIPVFQGSDNEFGFDTLVCEYGDEAAHAELLPLKGKLPIEADIEIMPVKKGNQTLHQIVGFKPVSKPDTK